MPRIPELFTELEKKLTNVVHDRPVDVSDYSHIVRKGTWFEGGFEDENWVERAVEGEIWSDAIEMALKENKSVVIPHMSHSIYIDKPIVLHAGNTLSVHSCTEIRLKPYTNTCMLRNEHMQAGQDAPLPLDMPRDEGICVIGGVWNAMNNGRPGGNGNLGGGLDSDESFIGAHGTFLFNSVKTLRIEGVNIKECTCHAIQICNTTEFIVLDVSLNVHRDGIHINAPADLGIVRGIRGKTGDDIVALNAWEWKNYAMTFGSIRHILVDDVAAKPGYMWSEIRLLAGKKLFDCGIVLNCDIRDCFFRRLRGLHTVKIYSQPNLELGREQDYSYSIGYLENISFSDMEIDYIRPEDYYCKKDAIFEICSEIDGLKIENVKVNYPLGNELNGNLRLVAVGPLSYTWKFGSDDPTSWVEVFEPDAICRLRRLEINNIYHMVNNNTKEYIMCTDLNWLTFERSQSINNDYPRTTPKGGMGYGKIN